MLVVNRFVVGDPGPDGSDGPGRDGGGPYDAAVAAFTARAHAALAALATRPGYLAGRLARALDEPSHWCLVTEWENVGTYRRALGAYDVKLAGAPLLAEALPEPSAYEVLASADRTGAVTVAASDRASDRGSDDAGPGALRSRA
ncbi:MAG TPA: antibiotic biosynthesis monooxygenase [Micromonosporaceae bacterium]|nr:antibiotic biosynthesis monooxygenase [Micromonosporaceae bacterium]